jgi:RNA polymerase sigma-70 factor (ECF subfamily)
VEQLRIADTKRGNAMEERDRPDRLSQIETAWTLVVRAHGTEESAAAEAQQALLERYLGAVYRYLLGATRDEDAAQELFQEFAIRFLRGGFRRADPERGQFRNLLKTALINLVNDHYKQEARRRRNQSTAELPDVASPQSGDAEQQFLDSWREELIAKAWDALADVEQTRGQPFYTLLKMHAEHPELRSADLAEKYSAEAGLQPPMTDVAARKTLQRAREKLSDLILDEVAHSLGGASLDEVEAELIDIGLIQHCRAAINRRREK